MKTDRRKWFIILSYGLLLAVCFGIVFFLRHLSNPGSLPENPGAQESSPAGEAQKGGDWATPSEAVRPKATPSQAREEKSSEAGFPEKDWEPEQEPEIWEPEPYQPPVVLLASDLHYYSPEMTDYGTAFQEMEQKDDGKAVRYVPQILDAFLEEVMEQKPSALVLSGDLTFNGERKGHEELAERLEEVLRAGVPVLVIPGNHDINNPDAASYFGQKKAGAETIDEEEFRRIYRDFGYGQALSEDEASLSYVYELDERNWLLMLDSCRYEPKNLVGGRIRAETLEWMRGQLELAQEAGIKVIPVAHHNLLKESGLYPEDCTLENSGEVIELLEGYELPLFVSGHLHLQRIKKHREYPGEPQDIYHISEIVSSSVTLFPCRYGILSWDEEGGLHYGTRDVDLSAWARDRGMEDENLLGFDAYGSDFLKDTVAGQVEEDLYVTLPQEQIDAMTELYGDLNRAYCAGERVDARAVRRSEPYRLWEKYLWETSLFVEINRILRDTEYDHNSWSSLWPG